MSKINLDGSCQLCPPFERAQDGNKRCGGNNCGIRDITKSDGTCTPCSALTRPDRLKTLCIAVVCDPDLKLNKDGECEKCPEYERYGLVRKSSGRPRVSAGGSIHYILMLDSSGSMGSP